MSYKDQILENLKNGNILPWYKNFADFCPAGKSGDKELVAKIFYSPHRILAWSEA